jgi:hypothetical protein
LHPGEIRRGLGGFRRGGEDRFFVFLHDHQPMGEILRVIGAGLVRDLKIGTQEGGAQLGHKLLHRIGLIAETFSKLPVAAGLCRTPMDKFMTTRTSGSRREATTNHIDRQHELAMCRIGLGDNLAGDVGEFFLVEGRRLLPGNKPYDQTSHD